MGIAYNTSIVRDGLVLHLDAANPKSYPGSGTVWRDLSGNGNDASLLNGAGFVSEETGHIIFDGANDWARNTTDGLIFPNNNASLAMWVRVKGRGDSSFNRFLDISPTSRTNVFYLYWDENDDRYGFGTTAGAIETLITGEDPVFNEWQYWTGIHNSTENFTEFYLDGVLSASGQAITTIPNCSYSVARRYDGGSDESNIDVSDIQIYNRALTESEIKKNFEAMRGRYGI